MAAKQERMCGVGLGRRRELDGLVWQVTVTVTGGRGQGPEGRTEGRSLRRDLRLTAAIKRG